MYWRKKEVYNDIEKGLGFDRPSGTNARRPSQKAEKRYWLHENQQNDNN